MSHLSYTRRSLPRMIGLFGFLTFAGLIGLAGQPPKEQEDTKVKPTKKIVVDDEEPKSAPKKKTADDDPAAGIKGTSVPPDVRLVELLSASEETRNKDLKELFTKYAVPFDRLVEGGTSLRVKPIPVVKSKWPIDKGFEVTPLDAAGKAKENRWVNVKDVKELETFEKLIQDEVDRLLKQKSDGLTPADQLAASEKLLLAALRFHDYSRTPRSVDGKPVNLRRDEGWDKVRDEVHNKLRVVELEYLRVLVAAHENGRVRELMARLIALHPNNKDVAQAIGGLQVAEAERLLKSGTDADDVAARKVIDELEKTFPGAGGEQAKKIKAQLRELASKALNRAREKVAVGDERTARDELVRAESLDPELDGIREMQRKLRIDYPILYVGVRQYPKNMSPITARLDSEKQAVELIFEGLMEEVPDESGAVYYRPGAALTLPIAVPGGRDFLLRVLDRDSAGRPVLDSHDVVGTVDYLRTRQASWASYPLTWLAAGAPVPKDNATVRISFGQAPPDPRSALTFKLLPYRWMLANARAVDDERFAENPFGTGPFSLHSRPKSDGSNAAREMVFVNNPAYGRWPDREGLPRIREVRFVEANKIDPVQAFQDGKLHILPDVPTAEIEKYAGVNSPVKNKVDVVTSTVNRRIYMLAVNLRRPELQSKQLRKGLSLAIDRDDILRKVFRDKRPDVHRALTGPFPPGTWVGAKGPTIPPSLMDLNAASLELKTYLADQGAKNTIELSFPDNDPLAEKACDEIKKQIEGVFKSEAANSRKLLINLRKVPLVELMVNVQDQHSSFDLAYIPFDYPDDWYPFALGAALDPAAAVERGRNWFSFLDRDTKPDTDDQELGRALGKLRAYRDFSGEILTQTAEITKAFNKSLPFIPLWQLDRHMVVSKRLKVFVDDTGGPVNPRILNQSILFQNVARWRIE